MRIARGSGMTTLLIPVIIWSPYLEQFPLRFKQKCIFTMPDIHPNVIAGSLPIWSNTSTRRVQAERFAILYVSCPGPCIVHLTNTMGRVLDPVQALVCADRVFVIENRDGEGTIKQ